MSHATVVVSAGSYHLPFNRLVDWMEPWVEAHPEVEVIMQHGPSRPLLGADNHDVLSYGDLLSKCSAATVVVLQGGAGAVMDMRQLRRIPIVVPRIPVDDEVVDDHQLVFTSRAAELNVIYRVTERERLWQKLDAAIAGTLVTRASAFDPTPGTAAAASRLTDIPPRLPWRVRMRRLARTVVGLMRR